MQYLGYTYPKTLVLACLKGRFRRVSYGFTDESGNPALGRAQEQRALHPGDGAPRSHETAGEVE